MRKTAIYDKNLRAIVRFAKGISAISESGFVVADFALQAMTIDEAIKGLREQLIRLIMISMIPLDPELYCDFVTKLSDANTGSVKITDPLNIALARDKVLGKLNEQANIIQALRANRGAEVANEEIFAAKKAISDIIFDGNWSWIRDYAIFINYSDDRIVAVYEEECWPEEVMLQM